MAFLQISVSFLVSSCCVPLTSLLSLTVGPHNIKIRLLACIPTALKVSSHIHALYSVHLPPSSGNNRLPPREIEQSWGRVSHFDRNSTFEVPKKKKKERKKPNEGGDYLRLLFPPRQGRTRLKTMTTHLPISANPASCRSAPPTSAASTA